MSTRVNLEPINQALKITWMNNRALSLVVKTAKTMKKTYRNCRTKFGTTSEYHT